MNMSLITEYVDGTVNQVTIDPNFGKASERVFKPLTFDHVLELFNSTIGFFKTNESDIMAWEGLMGIVIWAIGMVVPVITLGAASYIFDNSFKLLGWIIF